MPEIVPTSTVICKLERIIFDGKRALIFDHSDIEVLRLICIELKQKGISNIEIWYCIEDSSVYEHSIYITRQEMDEVLEIHRMYDFSDKFLVVSDSEQYGSLFNYVQTGILTKEEMVKALLYKI